MIVDARSILDKSTLETEVCIIGAGAAGITLAHQFIGRPFRVCVLESGDQELDLETQSLYKGKSIGLPYFPLDAARLRYFGGSTNHWGGMCRPFEERDFEAHPWIPYSGWPIRKADLMPFYESAATICQLKTAEWDPTYWQKQDQFTALPFANDRILTRLAQQVPKASRGFAKAYRDTIDQAQNVTLYVNANVTEIETDETGQTATGVQVACLAGNRFSVTAKLIILAVGGIENARLLLLSNKRYPNGLGNQNNLVGRFFLEHPRFVAGIFRPADPYTSVGLYQEHPVNDSILQAYLSLPEDVQQDEELVDVQIRLTPVYEEYYTQVFQSESVASFRYLGDALQKMEAPEDFGKHLGNIVFDLEDVAIFAYQKIMASELPLDHVKLVTRVNPVPNPNSRITLASELDQLGQNLAQIDWQLSPLDKTSIRRTLEIIGAEVGRTGLGRVMINLAEDETSWPQDLAGGWHHMGTTRMSDNPKQGVVDKNCQVHGLSNLFVAGSSVFPTAGSGTPTLTLVALALRLADYINKKMK